MALVTLKMAEALPIIREAFNNKTLQMFTPSEDLRCLYSGPCAIGVCVPEELRSTLDEGLTTEIGLLMKGYEAEEEGEEDIPPLVDVALSEREDFESLQIKHDDAVRYDDEDSNYHRDEFDLLLRRLEEKYLGHQIDIV